MHHKFFKEDEELQKITVPVISKKIEAIDGEISDLLPFRNTNCARPSCVYDIGELLKKIITSMKNNS